MRKPWPSMLRGIHGDPERLRKQYWSDDPRLVLHGRRRPPDEDGYFWVMGRVDDVLNVAGHRLGTAEIESALVSAPGSRRGGRRRAAPRVEGAGHLAFVTLEGGRRAHRRAEQGALAITWCSEIGALARPDEIRFTDALPKTRSGKIMRRLLKEIATTGKATGDVTTLEDLNVLGRLSAARDEE